MVGPDHDEGTFRMPKRPLPRLHRALTRLEISEAWVCELVLTTRKGGGSELHFARQVIREALRRWHQGTRAVSTVSSCCLRVLSAQTTRSYQ